MGVENGKSHLQLGYFSNGGNSSVVREVSRNSSGDGDGSKSNSNGEFHGAIIKGGGGGNRETKARAREGEIFQYSQWNLLKRVGNNRGDTPIDG